MLVVAFSSAWLAPRTAGFWWLLWTGMSCVTSQLPMKGIIHTEKQEYKLQQYHCQLVKRNSFHKYLCEANNAVHRANQPSIVLVETERFPNANKTAFKCRFTKRKWELFCPLLYFYYDRASFCIYQMASFQQLQHSSFSTLSTQYVLTYFTTQQAHGGSCILQKNGHFCQLLYP